MKLIFCTECQSTVTLKPKMVRGCECGNVKGTYVNNLDAKFVAKNERYFLIGYANSTFQQAVFDCNKYGEPGGMGVQFTAFVIPEPCPTFIKVTEDEFSRIVEKAEKPGQQTMQEFIHKKDALDNIGIHVQESANNPGHWVWVAPTVSSDEDDHYFDTAEGAWNGAWEDASRVARDVQEISKDDWDRMPLSEQVTFIENVALAR